MNFTIIADEQTPKVELVNGLVINYINDNLEKLVAFLDYASGKENAVGLAANQVALDGERFNLRVFAIRSIITRDWSLVINPEISEYLGLVDVKAEGCLTWKGKVIVAERHRAVKVKYYDMNGQIHVGVFSGFAGQIWQHEINHLNGVEEDVVEYFKEPKPIKPERNDPCPCGSGMKFKKCCLKYS